MSDDSELRKAMEIGAKSAELAQYESHNAELVA
jgi:hypothetical protein